MMVQVLQQQQLLQEASFIRQGSANPEKILDSLTSSIKEFRFDADAGVTFSSWYTRYDELFDKDAARLDDAAKVRLLLRSLGLAEHERYTSYILPQLPKNLSFAQTVAKLKTLFSVKESLVSRRYKCLQVSKSPTEDHVAYACRVNKLCVGFDIGNLSEDQFKCLVYVCGLKSECDVDLRTRLLTRIEESRDVTLELLSEEAQRLLNLKHDSAMIEGPASVSVQAVKQAGSEEKRHDQSPYKRPMTDTKRMPDYPCWFCGALHFVRDCTYKNHECADCNEVGHREGYCESAKKSRKRTKVSSNVVVVNGCSAQNNRKYVSIGVNGTSIRLQLDTASDITVIGKHIWKQVGSPTLSPATVDVSTASGNALHLVGQFTCKVTIADRTHREVIRVSERQLQLLGSDLVDSFRLCSMPMDAFCCRISTSLSSVPAINTSFKDVRSVVINSVEVLPLSFRSVEQSTQSDPPLCPICRYVKDGWPQTKAAKPGCFHVKREFVTTVADPLNRFGIPSQHRSRWLEQLHRGHTGIARMKSYEHCASVAPTLLNFPPVPCPESSDSRHCVHISFKWPGILGMRTISGPATTIQEGRNKLCDVLGSFFFTYRRTPNRLAPDGKSPSELLDPKLRTNVELQRSTAVQGQIEAIVRKRSDVQNSDVHQMRSCAGREPAPSCPAQHTRNLLPLNILLDAWSSPKPPELGCWASSSLSVRSTLLSMSTEETTIRWMPSARASSTSRRDPSQDPEPESSGPSSPEPSSSSLSSTHFNSTSESVMLQPRRSSWTRRAPQWFNPHHTF